MTWRSLVFIGMIDSQGLLKIKKLLRFRDGQTGVIKAHEEFENTMSGRALIVHGLLN